MTKPTGIERIAQERKEQIEKHGFNKEQDKLYVHGELVRAAKACISGNWFDFPAFWATSPIPKRIVVKPLMNRLIIAGAFYMAEQDRIGEDKYSLEIQELAAEIDHLQGMEE